jgi:ABC-type sugar transport system ATPase subunit
MNLVPARYSSGSISIAGHVLKTTMQTAGDRDVIAGIRPGALRLVPDGLKAKVDLIEDLGDTAVLDLDCAGTPMRARVNHDDLPREGDMISVTARAQDIHLFDPETRKRL